MTVLLSKVKDSKLCERGTLQDAVLLVMLMDLTVQPPAEDETRVINQRKSYKKGRPQKLQHVVRSDFPLELTGIFPQQL